MWASHAAAFERLQHYGLLQALLERRSRRFALGARLDGPLEFHSQSPPVPLTLEEEALLAFAASGITWYALADLPYPESTARPSIAGTTILAQLVGRTAPSGDALNSVIVFVMNDAGTWVLRRPQDLSDRELKDVIRLVRAHDFVSAYEALRVQVSGQRVTVSERPPISLPFNNWAANKPGTTYFLPVSEVSALYINSLLWAFGGETGYYIVDERNPFNPHGPLDRFRRSKGKGGHLNDDPKGGLVHTVGIAEALMFDFAAVEQGAVIQNLSLMAQALGLGSFPHYAAHPYAWLQALGFTFIDPDPKYSKTVGGDWIVRFLMRLKGVEDIDVPTAVGFKDSWNLVQPFCPPNNGWKSMSPAVCDYAEDKFADTRARLRDTDDTPWLKGHVGRVLFSIPRYSEEAKEATIAYCEYLHQRYRMFPAHGGPFRSVLAFQAHHVDLEFYKKYYQPSAVSDRQRLHWEDWHGGRGPAGPPPSGAEG